MLLTLLDAYQQSSLFVFVRTEPKQFCTTLDSGDHVNQERNLRTVELRCAAAVQLPQK